MSHGSNVFNQTGGLRPRTTSFDMKYDHKTTGDMGQLLPLFWQEVVPGDHGRFGNKTIVRLNPLVHPTMHDISLYVHYFFVPYRILHDGWEDFITGGEDGMSVGSVPAYMATLPSDPNVYDFRRGVSVGSLWDYLGFPIPANTNFLPNHTSSANAHNSLDSRENWPNGWLQLAYNKIYNDYYRNQNYQEPISLESNAIQRRNWMKDYFTSCLPAQQKGVAPALPVTGDLKAIFPAFPDALNFANNAQSGYFVDAGITTGTWHGNNRTAMSIMAANDGSSEPTAHLTIAGQRADGALQADTTLTAGDGITNVALHPDFRNYLNTNNIDASQLTAVAISELRTAFQIQKVLERTMRAGSRLTEYLRAHYGVSPRDERLQRPEYLGGCVSHVQLSEVLQTSEGSETPLAELAGHGIAYSNGRTRPYFVQEHGVVIGMYSVMPRTAYQQGMPREMMRHTRFDYMLPEFVHLSEQAVYKQELYWQFDQTPDKTIIGYQGIYNEMRARSGVVSGLMRADLDSWHLGRQFDSPPEINGDFLACNPSKRIFAVPSEPGLVFWTGHDSWLRRPLPLIAEPGFVDHC